MLRKEKEGNEKVELDAFAKLLEEQRLHHPMQKIHSMSERSRTRSLNNYNRYYDDIGPDTSSRAELGIHGYEMEPRNTIDEDGNVVKPFLKV
jgi:hypothetical protein